MRELVTQQLAVFEVGFLVEFTFFLVFKSQVVHGDPFVMLVVIFVTVPCTVIDEVEEIVKAVDAVPV